MHKQKNFLLKNPEKFYKKQMPIFDQYKSLELKNPLQINASGGEALLDQEKNGLNISNV